LYQGIEDLNVNNGTYVISWVGSDITAQYLLSTDTTANNGWDGAGTFQTVANGGTFTVNESPEHGKHLWIRFSGTLSNLDKVMVEEGTVATPFEHRPISVELSLAQRYYQNYISSNGTQVPGTGVWRNGTRFDCNFVLPVVMRSTPDIVAITNLANLNVYSGGSASSATAIALNGATSAICALNVTSSGGTAGNGGYMQPSGGSAGFSLEAEL